MHTMSRLVKPLYYLEIARAVSQRSTCMKKHWGAVIVKNDEVIATGYNGAPRGWVNCVENGNCPRMNMPRGTNYDICTAVHAEINAMLSASRRDMLHATMYIYGYDVTTGQLVSKPDSCTACKRTIINSGIDEIIFADKEGIGRFLDDIGYGYRVQKVSEWIKSEPLIMSKEGY